MGRELNVNNTEVTCISLCSGYEGIGLALKRVIPNLRTVLYSEIEKYACEVLVNRMEEGKIDLAPIWTDLKTLSCEQFSGRVDIITGGFPCQPFSCAGTQKGTEDPRHLWPHIEKTIAECNPQSVFLENVEGIISTKTILHRPKLVEYCEESERRLGKSWGSTFRSKLTGLCGISVLRYVKWRLERLGYRCESGIFSASEVGAPHSRKRVFILAHSKLRSGEAGRNPTGWEKRSDINWRCEQSELEYTKNTSKGRLSNREIKEQSKSGISSKHKLANYSGIGSKIRISKEGPREKRESEIINNCCNRWPARRGQSQFEWEEPRIVVNTGSKKQQGISQSEGRNEKREVGNPSGERIIESQLGRTINGTSSRVDPNLNRIDRLRLLGNGVVQDTAEKAFIVLHDRLTKPVENVQLSF